MQQQHTETKKIREHSGFLSRLQPITVFQKENNNLDCSVQNTQPFGPIVPIICFALGADDNAAFRCFTKSLQVDIAHETQIVVAYQLNNRNDHSGS